jgi:hypothetical protein
VLLASNSTLQPFYCLAYCQENEDDDGNHVGSEDNPYAPMEVLGDINEDGLGCVDWWVAGGNGGEEETAGDEDAGMPDAEQ